MDSKQLRRDASKVTASALIQPDQSPNIGAVSFLEAEIGIAAPAFNSILGGSFVVAGSARCDLLQDFPGEPGVFLRHADDAITAVHIRLGGAGPFMATPTGPGNTPWTSWSFNAAGVANGPLTFTAVE